jgi:hypothetical protein
MHTLKQLIDLIESRVSHLSPDDDSRFEPLIAKFYLDTMTAKIMTEQGYAEKKGLGRLQYYPELYSEVELDVVDGVAEVPEIYYRNPFGDGLLQVFITDEKGIPQPLAQIQPDTVRYATNTPFRKIAYYRLRDEIRIINSKHLKKITAQFIGNPVDPNGVDAADQVYPLPPEMAAQVVEAVAKSIMGDIQFPADLVNDAKDNSQA